MEFMKDYECEYIGFEQLTIFDFIEDHACDFSLPQKHPHLQYFDTEPPKVVASIRMKCVECNKEITKQWESIKTPSEGGLWTEIKPCPTIQNSVY
jgi:hypothetical protein